MAEPETPRRDLNLNPKPLSSTEFMRDRIDVEFEISTDVQADTSVLEQLVRRICTEAGIKKVIVSIRVVDDAQMIDAHRQFLGKETTTDVISFDLSDEFEPQRNFALIVNAALAARQAARRGHNMQAELALYITHGLLHNLGYDDGTDEESGRMHEKEDLILEQFGFGKIYHDNS